MYENSPWDNQVDIGMLEVDFRKAYDVYIDANQGRTHATNLSLSFLSAPFALITALLAAGVIRPEQLSAFDSMPSYVYVFIASCGFAGAIPLLRFIETTCTHARKARVINNFRRYYILRYQEHFASIGWESNLPTDPAFPPSFSLTNWSGMQISFFSMLNSTYVTIGILAIDGYRLLSFSALFIWIVSVGAQIAMYAWRAGKLGTSRYNTVPASIGRDSDTSTVRVEV